MCRHQIIWIRQDNRTIHVVEVDTTIDQIVGAYVVRSQLRAALKTSANCNDVTHRIIIHNYIPHDTHGRRLYVWPCETTRTLPTFSLFPLYTYHSQLHYLYRVSTSSKE